jgi:hypothetical protein
MGANPARDTSRGSEPLLQRLQTVKVDSLFIDRQTAGRRAVLDRSLISKLASRKDFMLLHIIFTILL